MRLLHLYSGNLYGGIERVLVTLARACRGDTGTAVDQRFALFFEGRLARELRAEGAAVDLLGPAAVSRPWRVLRARRMLSAAINRFAPDVVLSHSPWTLATAGHLIEDAGATRALWLHNPPARGRWPDGWALRKPLDLVIANSPYTQHASERFVHVDDWIYPPVEPVALSTAARRETLRLQHGARAGDVVILQASRLERWKGLDDHVAALSRLRNMPTWLLWIAGAPQRRHERAYLEAVRASAAAFGIADRVRFLGHRTDVPALMAACDIYCQPNTEPEPFGVALIEALSAGRPVITTPAGGLADTIAGTCGLVVPSGDPEALAHAIGDLLSSPERRAGLGSHGVAIAASLCDPRQQTRRLLKVLERAHAHARKPEGVRV
jgi:glycosyltransferase involved in cell wall biosynthesis